MSYPSRTSLKIIAVVVGIIAAGVPIILFNSWLRKQGDDEIAINATWALNSAESRIGQTIAALEDLSARGADSCGPAQLDAMRRTALWSRRLRHERLGGRDAHGVV